ncbi:RNA polymerase II-associated protein 1 isoform X1 [Adelges cooleyi]|uniref:RNA polymerase II-associated protein 1 isoform X1 n=1 Tax=Adelges cooleyi TaxID=133065 RepID=UPI00217FDD8B|nr:RNA polymerase II-associated protein 1 isoform X1 [Adelges cooleyi]
MTSKPRKQSLFAQKMQKQREKQDNDKTFENELSEETFGPASNILTGPEANDIHTENVLKLTSMTVEEIIKEKKELLSMLDGNIVEFLKTKHKNISNSGTYDLKHKDNNRVQLIKKSEQDKNKIPPQINDLINSGLNMDVIEDEKLNWIGDVEMNHKTQDIYTARFGLDGKLLPYVIENKTTVNGLHHHGEEQHRPGYTINELYSFLRTNHVPQRILALDVLSKLIDCSSIYDEVLNEPLICSLMDSGVFILLRMALDDTNIAVITNTLKAMGNLFARKIDRQILLGLSGCYCDIALPVYVVPDAEMDQKELDKSSDYDLVILDLVLGALRTDLILRLQYIVGNINIGLGSLLDICNILTGIAFRGEKYALIIIDTQLFRHLCKLVFTNVQSNTLSESVVTLTRVISSQSLKCSLKILEMKILDSIFKYISLPEKTPLLLECIYLWQTFFEHNLASQTIAELANLVLKFVDRSIGLSSDLTKTDLNLMSASLSLIDSALRHFGEIYIDPVYQLAEMILAKLLGSSDLPNFETSKLIGNCFSVLSSQNVKFDCITPKVITYLNKNFGRVCEILYEKSWLKSNYTNNSPKCYPNLGFITFSLNGGDPLFMLNGMMKFLSKTSQPFEIPTKFWTYIESLMKSPVEVSHWYARYETIFLISTLKAFVNNNSGLDVIHKTAIALLSFVPKHLSNELHSLLELYFSDEYVKHINHMSDFTILKSFYQLLIPNPKSKVTNILITELNPILPKDWLFMPILKVHETINFKSSKEGESLIKEALANVLFMEIHYPDICAQTPLSARYCRVACTFMCGRRGTVFHEVKPVLNQIWHLYAQHNNILNFKDPIPGIESFYEFYKTLCEHYVGVSYSDPVFGAYILLPLQRKHSVELRKLVWSEVDLAETINVDQEHLDRVPLSEYVHPIETNKELLKMYTKAKGFRRPLVMYHIAVSHLKRVAT